MQKTLFQINDALKIVVRLLRNIVQRERKKRQNFHLFHLNLKQFQFLKVVKCRN